MCSNSYEYCQSHSLSHPLDLFPALWFHTQISFVRSAVKLSFAAARILRARYLGGHREPSPARAVLSQNVLSSQLCFFVSGVFRVCVSINTKVCLRRNRNMRILRARFSALIPREILNSVQQLTPPNEHQAKAVEARQEIDLRLGSAFTRFQTMRLQVSNGCMVGRRRNEIE